MAPQDTFIDDEEDTCPLCIEEFDLSDKNFHPCPCGYQICRFCFNNLKNNMSGLCPACRRPYDEKDIKWKVVTYEEEAEFRANIQRNQKRRANEQRQKEVQKREAEKESRKNLQGVRVVQKNLVYVTGLTPTVREDELTKTLRKPEFFGQYGNIHKISISNRKSSDGESTSIGVYVTYERKEDAAQCIAAVNGSINGDRTLKAQLGTTKYCSAWLRHEQCGNKQCMFLHELGDEEDSYSRQDLSSLNSVHTQRPLPSTSRSASRQHGPTAPTSATSQPMVRTSSKEESDAGEGPALPPSANWARNNQQRSRRGSYATSGAASSPAISTLLPVTAESAQEAVDTTPAIETAAPTSRKMEKQPASSSPSEEHVASPTPPPKAEPEPFGFDMFMKILSSPAPPGLFEPRKPTGDPKDTGDDYPPLFDLNRAARRRAMRDYDDTRLGGHRGHLELREPSEGEPGSGSLALGGEPEDRDIGRDTTYDQRRNPAQMPIQRNPGNDLFGPSLPTLSQPSNAIGSASGRTTTPQQFMRPQGTFVDQMPPGISSQPSSLFQGQGHTRQQSRFSFANENNSSSINVKSTGDPRYMAQQNSMMPTTYRSQPYSVPGPPPGLKPTATPPVSGGMYGQGHSFGGSGFGAASKENSNDLLQSLIQGRSTTSGQAHDAGKHDDLLPLDEASESVDALVSDTYPWELTGHKSSVLLDTNLNSPFPPGFGFSHSHPFPRATEEDVSTVSPAQKGAPAGSKTSDFPALVRPVTFGGPQTPGRGLFSILKSPTPSVDSDAKRNIKELATKSGLAKDIAAQSSKPPRNKSLLHEEDFPALDSVKTSTPKITPALPYKSTQSGRPTHGKKVLTEDPSVQSLPETSAKKLGKRPIPGILDIAAATKTLEQSSAAPSSEGAAKPPSQAISSSAAQASKVIGASTLSTPTIATSSVPSPLAKAAPKTLRVVHTPKTESPSIYVPLPAVASVRSSVIPATPASEFISDTASVVSASISASRTSSPPPSKIGSASTRATTKSQQRKQRKDASKEASAQIVESKPVEQEAEIAPILGRKKKQKKEKRTTTISQAPTRPGSPAQEPQADATPDLPLSVQSSDVADKVLESNKDPVASEDLAGDKPGDTGDAKSPALVDTSIRLNESTKTTVLTPDYVGKTDETTQKELVDHDVGEVPNLRDVFRALLESGELSQIETVSFFRAMQGYRLDQAGSGPMSLPPTLKAIVTKEDEDKLGAFQPVRKVVNDHSVLLTPNGDCLLNLTEEEADGFLEYQDRVRADSALPTSFASPRYAPASGFSLVKNRAVPNGMPSFFPSGRDNYPSDPVAKMHREEAISCINQHVLPSLNLGNYKTVGNGNLNKNVNLQQLAPWIYPASENSEEQRKMFSGRAGDEYGPTLNSGAPADGAYGRYDSPEVGPSPPIGSTPLMSVEEAEMVLSQAKKQHDALDKKFRQVQAKNRRLVELY